MTITQAVPEPVTPEPAQLSVPETIAAMAETIVTGEPAPALEPTPAFAAVSPDMLSRAFDRGARLAQPEAPADGERPPLVTPEIRTRKPRGPRARPAGADEVQALFAAGLILLITFAIGEWALPTEEETDAFARPLANIVARRIDLAAKLGADANDVIALAVALMSYTVRVGPIAAERIRYGIAERRANRDATRVTPAGFGNSDRTVDVGIGDDDGERSGAGPAYHPFDALASARDLGLGILARDLHGDQGSTTPVGLGG